MSSICITHQARAFQWPTPRRFDPHTVVLGSFNPYNPHTPAQHVDYHYGRRGNLFWPAVAQALSLPHHHFVDRPDRKFHTMQNRFACADVVDALHLSGSTEATRFFAEQRIFVGFSDADLWKRNSRTPLGPVQIHRDYNEGILRFLRRSPHVRKVIHTMGKNTLSHRGVYPVERTATRGFGAYIADIREVCAGRNIEFVTDCPAPAPRSAAAWGSRSGYLDLLADFYRKHLFGT